MSRSDFPRLAANYVRQAPVLTPAQSGRLSGIHANDMGAKVVAWDFAHEGPVVVLSTGQRVVITPRGRKIKL